MDIPQPPPDEDTRNIIDRLANFVARNGLEFEGMTKQKQKDNPKFQFLFGGEYYNYYTYRVTSEQALLKHQAMRQQQQQQQMQMQPGLMPQNFGPNPRFGPPGNNGGGGPRGPSRFGPSMQPFERSQGGFDRPPFQNYDRPGFDGGAPHGGNFQHFERVPPGINPFEPRMNFDRPSGQGQGGMNFQGQGPRQGFERQPGPGPHFERERAPNLGSRFDVPASHSQIRPNLNMERAPNPGSRFDVPGPNLHIQRAAGPGIGPNLGFERIPGPTSFGSQNNFESPSVSVAPVIPTPIPPPTVNLEALAAKKAGIQEQILQSENNLAAQHQVLLSQQQTQVEEALRLAQDTEITQLATELGVDITEFAKLLQTIMDSCTKESISNGKAWIFTHTSTPRHYDLITSYLLRKVTDPKLTFHQRLHVIYLVNDTLHHCVRRGAADIQQALEKMVIPMFCFTKVNELEDAENLGKLNKLFSLWEAKPNYISQLAVERLNNFSHTWLEYKNEVVTRHALIVTQIAANIQKTYEGYQSQHLLFIHHMNQNIKQIEQQIEDAHLQQQQYQVQLEKVRVQQEQQRIQQEQLRQQQEAHMRQQQQIPAMRTGSQPMMSGHSGVGLLPNPNIAGLGAPGPGPYPQGQGPPGAAGQGRPQGFMPPGMGLLGSKPADQETDGSIPDLSRPPPGFAHNPNLEIPRLPYFELPAGLMVPLVAPEDDNYKPIDPKAIRLPPPCQPSERLMQAVEAFYGPPSHDNPRDSEGWERLGLYEYYKTKNLARKQKEDDVREGRREKSQSPSPVRREVSPCGRSPPRRRYQSKSPTPTKRRRTRSPRSPSSRRGNSSRRGKRSRSRSPIKRSPTPPSFGTAGLGSSSKLDESNKGHQLLRKMGWGGTGLGANEQGIEAPIQGGDIRDRKDQYKGVGINLHDPFESYRKTKGQAFVDRMRQRAEDRP